MSENSNVNEKIFGFSFSKKEKKKQHTLDDEITQ